MQSDFCSEHNLHLYNIFGVQEQSDIQSAFLMHENLIEIKLKAQISVKAISVYRINYERMDAKGHFFNEIITDFTEHISGNQIFITGHFDTAHNYRIRINNEQVNVILDTALGGILDTKFDITNEENFGAKIINNTAYFKLWSPPAGRIDIVLYDKNQERIYTEYPLKMTRSDKGIWVFELHPEDIGLENIDAYYYKFAVYAYGNMRIAIDPYALSTAAYDANPENPNPKAALLDVEKLNHKPVSFKNAQTCPNHTDIIAYEINVRDFTVQPGLIAQKEAGTYIGFTRKTDYLQKLGITHVQLMPVNKCFTLNETDREYTGQDAADSNYNWGYDPLNYYSLEGRYCTTPENPYNRIDEFRQMTDDLHEKNIGIIVDVVFNHTYKAEIFECLAPGCYYRYDENHRISGHTGAGSSLESRRKSVRKFIIDTLIHFVTFYNIDGFRFDLMSFTDIETMRQIREKVGKTYNPHNINDLILQGEAWEFTDINDKTAYTKLNHPSKLNIALFNDSFRDACTGHDSYPGFAQGNGHEISRLATGIIGGLINYNKNTAFSNEIFDNIYNRFAFEPEECLNYFAIHDGLTLWDKINLSVNDGDKQLRTQIAKLAFAILLTSQGRIIIHGGDEIMRTKPLAHNDKEKHRAMTSHHVNEEEGQVFFHENSYSSPDYTNMFRWERLENEFAPFAKDLLSYVQGLIAIRKSCSALRLPSSKLINQNLEIIHPAPIYETKPSFFELDKFTIHFKNGIPNSRYYIVGEVHSGKTNPLLNEYVVKFDTFGNGAFTFNKNQIRKFNLRKWSKDLNLHFKLIKTPGKWDYISYAYSSHGENAVSARQINDKGEVWIDLGIKNHRLTDSSHHIDSQTIAYKTNSLTSDKYEMLIVAHNSGTMESVIENDEINPKDWILLADGKFAGLTAITESKAKISDKKIIVPPHSSIIIAKVRR